jgi:hypothetical protein
MVSGIYTVNIITDGAQNPAFSLGHTRELTDIFLSKSHEVSSIHKKIYYMLICVAS